MDILRFNKGGSRLTILANNRPTSFVGKDAEKNLDRLSRFTAIMVCTIAALKAFAPRETVRLVLKSVLLELLQTTQWGEDVLASHFPNRANSWQSAADVRGLSGKAREIRQDLLSRNLILDGLMPDGHWGYRSLHFLTHMRTVYLSEFQFEGQGILVFRREDVVSIVSSLLCDHEKLITRVKRDSFNRDNWCVGVIGKRTLLVRSLLKPCQRISDIGKFVLLDINVSGIPRDTHGLVRPGVADGDQYYPPEPLSDVVAETLNEHVSFHIESDWAGDPNTMLICVHYKGRRAWTLNPAIADGVFCSSALPSRSNSTVTSHAEVNITQLAARDCLNRRQVKQTHSKSSFILQVTGMPRLCYAILYWYHREHTVRLVAKSSDASTLYTRTETASKFSFILCHRQRFRMLPTGRRDTC